MKNEKFYPVKERKNDFVVTVNYLQLGETTHTIKKSVLKGRKLIGMLTYEIENSDYKTEEEYNKAICKSKSDRLKIITTSNWVYENN
jgi:predicted RNA-binding protein